MLSSSSDIEMSSPLLSPPSTSRHIFNRSIELTDLTAPRIGYPHTYIPNPFRFGPTSSKRIQLLANSNATTTTTNPAFNSQIATPVTSLMHNLKSTLLLEASSSLHHQILVEPEVLRPSSSYLSTSLQQSEFLATPDKQFCIPCSPLKVVRQPCPLIQSPPLLQRRRCNDINLYLSAEVSDPSLHERTIQDTPCSNKRRLKLLKRSFSCMDSLMPGHTESDGSVHDSQPNLHRSPNTVHIGLNQSISFPPIQPPTTLQVIIPTEEVEPAEEKCKSPLYHRPGKRTSSSINACAFNSDTLVKAPVFHHSKSVDYLSPIFGVDHDQSSRTSTSPCIRPPKSRKVQSSKYNMDQQNVLKRTEGPPVDLPSVPGTALLPSVQGPCDSIRRISPKTLLNLMNEKYKSTVKEYMIIDVRFPFEYNGGHIQGAMNVNSFETLNSMFFNPPKREHAKVIVFHCEFSSHRAPMMAKHLRAQDRIMNVAHYPAVYYPEIYVLEGGYKSFWTQVPTHCIPMAYVPMDDDAYRSECRHESKLRKISLQRSKSGSDVTSFLAIDRLKSASVDQIRPLVISRPCTAPQ